MFRFRGQSIVLAALVSLASCGEGQKAATSGPPAKGEPGPAATTAQAAAESGARVRKEPSKVESILRPPGLDAELDKRGQTVLERGYEPAKCDEAGYQVHEMEGYGKFYIEPKTTDAIKGQLLKGIEWEPHLRPLLARYIKPGSVVIDVGAHIGTHVVTMSKLVGEEGHVFAFEPQDKIFSELSCNLSLNDVKNATPVQMALGDSFGELELDPANPENEGGVGVGKGGAKVPLVPLDSYKFENVSVLKIDVEGFEDHVLEGARRTIAAHHPVIFIEIMGGNNWDTAPPNVRARISNTAHTLTAMGYRVDRVGVFDYLAQDKDAPPPPEATRKGGRKVGP